MYLLTIFMLSVLPVIKNTVIITPNRIKNIGSNIEITALKDLNTVMHFFLKTASN